MNKETIKEAAITYWQTQIRRDTANPSNTAFCTRDFRAGAEWQKEQSATEAIEFAEWIKENQFYEAKGMWMRKNALTGENEGRYNWTSLTSKQLYELYKQSML